MILAKCLPLIVNGALGAALGLALGGCTAVPGMRAATEPVVVTETGIATLEASAAESEATVNAAALDAPAADIVTPPETAAAPATRPEPRSAAEVAAIQAELELLAERRSAGASGRELAVLEARAEELRRLIAAAQAGPLRAGGL